MTEGEKMITRFGYELIRNGGSFGETWALRTEYANIAVVIFEPGVTIGFELYDEDASAESVTLSYGIMEAIMLRRGEIQAAAQEVQV